MKSFVWKVMVAGVFLMGFLSVETRAQGNDNDGCSNATLRGDYAFTVSGTIWVTDPGGVLEEVQRGGIAMTHFDGIGGLIPGRFCDVGSQQFADAPDSSY